LREHQLIKNRTAQSTELHQFVSVQFRRFKAFESFTLRLGRFNILVGPNNAGKSTILAAFRILAAALRRANSRRAVYVRGPNGRTLGHLIELGTISVAEENLFHDYDDSLPASVAFKLSNGHTLTLYFPEQKTCYLLMDAMGRKVETPNAFKKHFNCPIGFVPILGPVEHHELLFEKDAARLALFSYRAARNFRNIWHHYPEEFERFRALLIQTWPGMDIQRPTIDMSGEGRPALHMFCPEERIPREIFWAGFGFQVWCQMLTHLVLSAKSALFLIDEPDIYLHSELQRQLLSILRNLGPDILIATHSTEIISDAESDEIVLVNKLRRLARRIRNPSQLGEVFSLLGSNINPVLTQLAKTRRVLFLEGRDFQILGKFARKLNLNRVGNRSDFAVVTTGGFNPERIKTLKAGMEETLGGKVVAAAILDRDYRSQSECDAVLSDCSAFCTSAKIHNCKEIENYLLVPDAIDRAIARKLADRARRNQVVRVAEPLAHGILEAFAEDRRSYVMAQHVALRRQFAKRSSPDVNEATVMEAALREFDRAWRNAETRLQLIPGKDAISYLNQEIQARFGVSITATAIIDAMLEGEVPAGIREIMTLLSGFVQSRPGNRVALA
jgi:predicted ATPase